MKLLSSLEILCFCLWMFSSIKNRIDDNWKKNWKGDKGNDKRCIFEFCAVWNTLYRLNSVFCLPEERKKKFHANNKQNSIIRLENVVSFLFSSIDISCCCLFIGEWILHNVYILQINFCLYVPNYAYENTINFRHTRCLFMKW